MSETSMTVFDFYKREKNNQQHNLDKANSRLNISSLVRLLVFLATAFGIYYFFAESKIAGLIAFIGVIVFLFLVSRHTDLKYKRDKILELVKLNETELRVLKRDFAHLPAGNEFANPLHPYSQDIDLFGEGSFFQYLNRSALKEGKNKLAHLLTENSIIEISKKQDAIRELSEKVLW